MSAYLDNINKEYETKDFCDWCLDIILDGYIMTDDELYAIINPHIEHLRQNIKIETNFQEDQIEILLNNLEKNNTLLVDVILFYLLALNDSKYLDSFIDKSKKYVEQYVLNFDNTNCELISDNLVIILKWVINTKGNVKSHFSNYFFEKLIKSGFSAHDKILVFKYFLNDEILKKFLTSKQYEKVFFENFISVVEKDEVPVFEYIYRAYLNYLDDMSKENSKKEQELKTVRNKFLRKYYEFVMDNISSFKLTAVQEILELLKADVIKSKKFSEKDIRNLEKIMKEKDKRVKEYVDKLERLAPIDINKEFKGEINEQRAKLKSFTNKEKLVYLLDSIDPFPLREMIDSYFKNDNVFSQFYETHSHNDEGRLLNYMSKKEMKDEFSADDKNGPIESELVCKMLKSQNFIFETNEFRVDFLKINFCLLINQFYDLFKLDVESENFLKTNLSSSEFIKKEESADMLFWISEFLKGNFYPSVGIIILKFENSLRFYLKNKDLSLFSKKSHKSEILIGLSDILNPNLENDYRTKLLEIMDLDYYYTLCTMLTSFDDFNIRNQIAHTDFNKKYFESCPPIFVTFLIIKLYFKINLLKLDNFNVYYCFECINE